MGGNLGHLIGRLGWVAQLSVSGVCAAALLVVATSPARADLIFPPLIERQSPTRVVFRLPNPATGKGELQWSWSDADGRLVQKTTIPVALNDASEVAFTLDTRRAVTTLNFLAVHVRAANGAAFSEKAESASFIVSPAPPTWRDYHIIMWQPQSASTDRVLKGLGVDAGMVHADRERPDRLVSDEADPLLASDERWFVENIATDFYSAYHRYFPNRPPNWRFTDVQNKYRASPSDRTALVRDPSLSDPAWLARIRQRLISTVHLEERYQPLYYNLADESGIADLAAFWDFDYSPASLEGFRSWLQGQYPSLAALNREWATHYGDWGSIVPETTAEAIGRTDENFSSWADMKAWMDVAFARALAAGRDAVHEADSNAFAAIEGGQVPGWGGYDYALLTRSVDLMEIYDAGDNVAIAHSLAPDMPILTTAFPNPGGAEEESRVWRELLRGSRGLVLWDEKRQFVDPDGTPGPRAAAASYFRPLRNGIGALFAASEPIWDGIAILYSPASQRTAWMVEWKGKGDAWIGRDSEAEGGDTHNPVRASVRAFMANFEHLGFEPRFVSSSQLASGALAAGNYLVLVLPHSIALSAEEARAIRRFAESGGMVLADTEPGIFDQHARRLAKGPLADLFGRRIEPFTPSLVDGNVERPERTSLSALRKLLGDAGIAPRFKLGHADGTPVEDVVTHRLLDGEVTILGLQRDFDAATLGSERVVLALAHPAAAYDLLRQKQLGLSDRVELDIDPVKPTLLAISPRPLKEPSIRGPSQARRGEVTTFKIGIGGETIRHSCVLHVDVEDPDDRPKLAYGKNIVVREDDGKFALPLALNDPIGRWRLRFTDVATGMTVFRVLDVTP